MGIQTLIEYKPASPNETGDDKLFEKIGKKNCEYESIIDRYFSNPKCPDIRYNYSLF